MTTITRNSVRQLYNVACHGLGPSQRMGARDLLDGIADREGYSGVCAMLDDLGLDLSAFLASLPVLH